MKHVCKRHDGRKLWRFYTSMGTLVVNEEQTPVLKWRAYWLDEFVPMPPVSAFGNDIAELMADLRNDLALHLAERFAGIKP